MDTASQFLPIQNTLTVFDGKWKVAIIYYLFEYKVVRFNEMRRLLPGVTQKMLTAQLRALENDGIVRREIFPIIPPKVEYSLTQKGMSLCPILEEMRAWHQAQEA